VGGRVHRVVAQVDDDLLEFRLGNQNAAGLAIRSLKELDVSLGDLSGTRQQVVSEADSLATAELVAERTARVEAAGRLAGSMAHDLGNALAAVLGWASLLFDEPEPEASDVESAVSAFDESAEYAETLLLQETLH
jgi:signal transduction histidine kinase